MASSEENWESETMFDLYLHDYMVKKKMKRSAAIFKHEAKLPDHSVAIDDSQKGMLNDWWSFFWDVFAKTHFRSNDKDKPEDSLQKMQSHNSTETEGRASGSSSGTRGLNIPNSSSSVRVTSSSLPPQVEQERIITAWGKLITPVPFESDDEVDDYELSRILEETFHMDGL